MEKKLRYLPLGASAIHAQDPVRAINDALSTRANFVRNYLNNPYDNYLDPVLRHHLGLSAEALAKVEEKRKQP